MEILMPFETSPEYVLRVVVDDATARVKARFDPSFLTKLFGISCKDFNNNNQTEEGQAKNRVLKIKMGKMIEDLEGIIFLRLNQDYDGGNSSGDDDDLPVIYRVEPPQIDRISELIDIYESL
eukprot:TRINITY_DN14442_c0_g1_i1.p1 TRINITY_DN14442_c0_g1~~TRINITY_DN14442_c0_g1_i1.p1  ORF type:complete len:135 (+),score=32.12 TRINITY_DN14442_c0_g1_i1:41-406(+)